MRDGHGRETQSETDRERGMKENSEKKREAEREDHSRGDGSKEVRKAECFPAVPQALVKFRKVFISKKDSKRGRHIDHNVFSFLFHILIAYFRWFSAYFFFPHSKPKCSIYLNFAKLETVTETADKKFFIS